MLKDLFQVCSTILVHSKVSVFVPRSIPCVLMDNPRNHLDHIYYQNCVNVMTDVQNFDNVSLVISRSRVKANLVAIASKSEKIVQEANKLNFNVAIGHMTQNKGLVLDIVHSPFDATGKAFNRVVRAGHIASRIPLENSRDLLSLNGGILLKMMKNPLDIRPDFRDTGARTSVGVLDLLRSGAADVAIYMPSFDIARYEEGFDLSPGLGKRGIGFLRPLKQLRGSNTTLIHPLSSAVWIWLVVSTLAVWLCVAVVRRFTFKDVALSTAMLVKESLPHHWFERAGMKSIRSSLALWILSQTILAYSYTSNLLSHLIKTEFEKQPETLQDLLDMNKEIHIVKDRLAHNLLRTSPVRAHKELYQHGVLERGGFYETQRNVWPPEHLNDAYREGNIIGMSYSDIMVFHNHNSEMINEYIYSSPLGYYYGLKFPLKEEIDMALLTLFDAGIVQREKYIRDQLVAKLFFPSSNLSRMDGQSMLSLSLSHLTPSFSIVVVALGFSGMVFLSEAFCYWKQKRGAKEQSRISVKG